MNEKPNYAVARGHLDTAKELLDRAFGHLVTASRAGADTFDIQLVVDKALGLTRIERQNVDEKLEEEKC